MWGDINMNINMGKSTTNMRIVEFMRKYAIANEEISILRLRHWR